MNDPHEFNWDHLRVFLAVMRASSLRAAAEQMHVSHPTVRRRLEALEGLFGLRLFDRRSDGLHATPEAVELLEYAEAVEASILALCRRAAQANPTLRGSIRVTAPDLLMTDLLMPALAGFGERWPELELEVDTSYELANLGGREADVAVRVMPHGKLPDGDLTGRLAATVWQAIYGEEHQWIGWWGEARDREWIRETPYPDLPVRGRFPSPMLQRPACVAGMGLSQLPCYFADPVLDRRTEPKPAFDVWILVHPDLRKSPRLRIFRDEMVAALGALQPRLQGLS